MIQILLITALVFISFRFFRASQNIRKFKEKGDQESLIREK